MRGVIPITWKVCYFMTVYNLLKQSNLPIKAEDIQQIGRNISTSSKALQVPFEMISQKEGRKKFTVKDYPETFVPRMQKLIGRFYALRAKKLAK